MKKLTAILLTLVLCLGLFVGCGSKNTKPVSIVNHNSSTIFLCKGNNFW